MGFYNLDGLKEMAQGNEDFIKNMINVFLEHTPPILEEVNQAFKQGDLQKVGELAHQIKPSIDLMGIESLHQEIRDIEQKGKKDTVEGLDEQIKNLNTVLTEVFDTMKTEM